MVKKKVAVGRRALSIILALLMILCAVPMISFAAIEPIVPDKDVTYPVLDRSAPDIMLFKSIKPIDQQATIEVGSRLGDFTFVKTGVRISQVRENGLIAKNYSTGTLTVEFVNKDALAKEGTNRETVRIFVTADPSIWIDIEYTFEAVQGSGIPEAVIETLPTTTAVVYREGLKASDVELIGGSATVNGAALEGAFAYANPDQVLYAGKNQVEVVFNPADPAVAEPATATITVEVEKADMVLTTPPTVTLTYGQTLKVHGNADRNFVGAVSTPADVKFNFLDGVRPVDEAARVEWALPAGDHVVKAHMTTTNNNYNKGPVLVDVNVKVLPYTGALEIRLDGSENEAVRYISVSDGTANLTPKGTFTIKVNGVVLKADAQKNEKVEWRPGSDGAYTITAEYNRVDANDSCDYQMATRTTEISLPRTVTVVGGTGSGSYKPGTKVGVSLEVESLPKYNEFKGWKATNANGETVDVGVADMTQPNITITVPGEDVTLTAQSSFSINLFFQAIGQSILNFFMKIAEFFQNLFSGNGIG